VINVTKSNKDMRSINGAFFSIDDVFADLSRITVNEDESGNKYYETDGNFLGYK